MPEPAKRLRCSFCRFDQDQVALLIAGPDVFICDACVETCVEVMADAPRLRVQRWLTAARRANRRGSAGMAVWQYARAA